MKRRELGLLSLVLWLQVSGIASGSDTTGEGCRTVYRSVPAGPIRRFAQFHAGAGELERFDRSATGFSVLEVLVAMPLLQICSSAANLRRRFAIRLPALPRRATIKCRSRRSALHPIWPICLPGRWLLKRGTTPYELIEAIDSYLTKINFPVEESRMQFVLVREVDSWYISTVLTRNLRNCSSSCRGRRSSAPRLQRRAHLHQPGPGAHRGTARCHHHVK